ncbi:AfsR/SARP family transcriptional regulator [Saccharothrix australiensis]|uniref:DNA-binding SARP family transcriptional activator n=1 Tax=Saccharothrix australiensis TaxID=2072 RepID=A0A495W0L2_9PSEU|nr:BTAD domain-containing putative transcriptional regulator [Saccharothrix australiensis]RKT54650.1 DNA-binding SARP family transcriptional activator [Saccharothrix australiensis]
MEFHVLGPLEVRESEEVVRIPGARQRKLLALLLLDARRVVTVERLIDELWDDPPRSVRQQVHNAVRTLRTTLGARRQDVRVTRTDTGYRLDVADDAIDARRFTSLVREAKEAQAAGDAATAIRLLRSALDLWRGDAFEGLDGSEVLNAAAGLAEQRLVATEDLLELRLAAGEAGAVVGELRRLVADHPLRDRLRATLMRALHRGGRQAEALAVYEEGRRVFAEELGLDPGPELRGLHAAILDGAGEVPPPSPVTAPEATTGRASRSYLPHDIRDFSGRAPELVRLLAETRQDRPSALVITAIDGMGGVGKTTLAVHLAHKVADDFPDGRYFIDLHGFSPGLAPLTAEQALDALLRDAGVPPELVPSDLDGRSALWRSHMAGKRALVVLDNAIDAGHVRPLLPGGPEVLVIITSRRKMAALDGVTPMSLDVMTTADGIALFRKVAGEQRTAGEPAEVAAAVELCGHLPLAIRVAAARLRDRATWRVSDLLARLRDQAARSQFLTVDDRNVMRVLRVSYRYLRPDAQRLFRRLALHVGKDFDAYAAAALADLDPAHAEELLEGLFDDNLLKQNAAGRYHFHDLIRDCARQILVETEDQAELDAARARLLDYYLHSCHVWSRGLDNRVYDLPPPVGRRPAHVRVPASDDRALALLAEEHENLVAAARCAAEHGMHRHTWGFACALQPALRLRNYGEDALALFEQGLRAARADGDPRAESACLHGLAVAHREREDTASAEELLRQALDRSRALGDRTREAAQLVDLGIVHFSDDRLAEAHDAFQAAERLTRDQRDTTLRAAIENSLGAVERDLGRYAEALERLRGALASAANEGSPHAQQLTAWSIGAIQHFQGRHAEAARTFGDILRVSEQRNFDHGRAVALLGLASVHRSVGELDRALDTGRSALEQARKLGLHALECETLIVIGEVMVSRGELDQAEQVFGQAYDRADRYALRRYLARVLEGLAHVAAARGAGAEATRLWEDAVAAYPEGMAEAGFARAHLSGATTCFRCAIAA